MSRLVARILLTVLMFPAAILFFLICFIVVERMWFSRDANAVLISLIPGSLFLIGYWLMLWRRAVSWTPQRIRATWWAASGAAIAGTCIGLGIQAMFPDEQWIGTFLGVLCGLVIWIIATVFIWRESEAERAARLSRANSDALVCPTCGYNLTGLRETRCPECGTQFTLNELYAAQPQRATAELEKA
jgi:CDP-diglyceride synthetase